MRGEALLAVMAMVATGCSSAPEPTSCPGAGQLIPAVEIPAVHADPVKIPQQTIGGETRRLTATGYGENKPVAPNRPADGTDDPAGRAKNRRVVISADR